MSSMPGIAVLAISDHVLVGAARRPGLDGRALPEDQEPDTGAASRDGADLDQVLRQVQFGGQAGLGDVGHGLPALLGADDDGQASLAHLLVLQEHGAGCDAPSIAKCSPHHWAWGLS